ncbi:MAG: TrmH family RNA methyltransferase [bacterium]
MSIIKHNNELEGPETVVKASKKPNFDVVVVLPDIRSAHNVGSVFRTSDAAGVNNIYISGYSPTPLNKFNRPQPEIAKTALGAEKSIPWKYFESHTSMLNSLKKDGFKIVAVEQTKDSVSYKNLNLIDFLDGGKKVAFIFGNEVDGLPKKILSKVDICVELPMKGMKESLNVSVTAGIVLFQYLV